MDLTTLARLKAWLPSTSGIDDPTLQRTITAVSAAIAQFVSRCIVSARFDEMYDSYGCSAVMLRQYPVTEVFAFSVDACVIKASTPPFGYGWRLSAVPEQAATISLIGGYIERGVQNVGISYQAGYQVAAEPQTISAEPTVTGQFWRSDVKVTKADGSPMVKVTASPISGQYIVDAVGNYGFATADIGQVALITYGTVPADIEAAAMDACSALIGGRTLDPNIASRRAGDTEEKYRQLGALGSQAIGLILLTPNISSLLAPYRRVAMV